MASATLISRTTKRVASSSLDLRFQSFGLWLVQGKQPGALRDGLPFWLCQCACGTQVAIHEAALTEGRARSCGCDHRASNGQRLRMKDLTGQQFGRWLVLFYRREYKQANSRYQCRCACGNEHLVQTTNLGRNDSRASTQCVECASKGLSKVKAARWYGKWFTLRSAGVTKNGARLWLCRCRGCLQEKQIVGAELVRGRSKSCNSCKNQGDAPPMIGRTFGRWYVLERDYDAHTRATRYLCQCSCPLRTVRSVSAGLLRRGDSKSCGCLRKEVSSETLARRHAARALGKIDITFWQQFVMPPTPAPALVEAAP